MPYASRRATKSECYKVPQQHDNTQTYIARVGELALHVLCCVALCRRRSPLPMSLVLFGLCPHDCTLALYCCALVQPRNHCRQTQLQPSSHMHKHKHKHIQPQWNTQKQSNLHPSHHDGRPCGGPVDFLTCPFLVSSLLTTRLPLV